MYQVILYYKYVKVGDPVGLAASQKLLCKRLGLLGRIIVAVEEINGTLEGSTGGVRCEKASAFLLENGFEDVYQLKDGIITYMEKYPNQHFKGKLYVFDQRILVAFNVEDPTHQMIGHCRKCSQLSERYVNCANDECHLHFICCEGCTENGQAFCSENCWEVISTGQNANHLKISSRIRTEEFV
jgi:predicted sulfurtransferase